MRRKISIITASARGCVSQDSVVTSSPAYQIRPKARAALPVGADAQLAAAIEAWLTAPGR